MSTSGLDLDVLGDLPFVYVTTTGRRTGRPHRIEIWFARAPERGTLYLLAGGGRRSDWVANALAAPDAVTVELGDHTVEASARLIDDADEDATARRLVFEKYQPGYDGDLTGWRASALPVALDLTAG